MAAATCLNFLSDRFEAERLVVRDDFQYMARVYGFFKNADTSYKYDDLISDRHFTSMPRLDIGLVRDEVQTAQNRSDMPLIHSKLKQDENPIIVALQALQPISSMQNTVSALSTALLPPRQPTIAELSLTLTELGEIDFSFLKKIADDAALAAEQKHEPNNREIGSMLMHGVRSNYKVLTYGKPVSLAIVDSRNPTRLQLIYPEQVMNKSYLDNYKDEVYFSIPGNGPLEPRRSNTIEQLLQTRDQTRINNHMWLKTMFGCDALFDTLTA